MKTNTARTLAALNATNEAILYAKSPEELYEKVCEAAFSSGGFLATAVFLLIPGTNLLRFTAGFGEDTQRLRSIDKVCGAEDFSFYQKEVPGFFYFIGCTPPDRDAKKVPTNHSPRFYVDEASLKLGTETLAALALDWLSSNGKR